MGDQTALGNFPFNPLISILSVSESLNLDPDALLLRELMEQTGMDSWLGTRLQGGKGQRRIGHRLIELMQTQWLHLSLEYHTRSDRAQVKHGHRSRSGKGQHRGQTPAAHSAGCLALPSRLLRSLKVLSNRPNLHILREAVGELACRRIVQDNQGHPHERLIVDVDEASVRVAVPQSDNRSDLYHPDWIQHGILALDWKGRYLLGAAIRPGTKSAAESGGGLIRKIVRQQRGRSCGRTLVRMDAAFSNGGLPDELEEDGIDYLARIGSSSALEKAASPLIDAASDSPSSGDGIRLHELRHKADEWTRKRRVILVVEETPGKLFPDYFGLVTSLPTETWDGATLLKTWHQRGTAEKHIGTLMNFLAPALLQSPRWENDVSDNFAGRPPGAAQRELGDNSDGAEPGNEVLFLLHALAYNLMR